MQHRFLKHVVYTHKSVHYYMFFQSHIGEIASLGVAFCWTISALFFEKVGHKVGSLSVNLIRIFLAIIFLGFALVLTGHSFIPTNATAYNWFC